MKKSELEKIIAASLVEALPYARDKYLEAVDCLKPEHFKNETYRLIFAAYMDDALDSVMIHIGTIKEMRNNFKIFNVLRGYAIELTGAK